MPLLAAVSHFAIASATQDRRFQPIKRREIPDLTCHINLLRDFEACQSHLDWTIGQHGVVVEYDGRRATFLPHVAMEQEWSHTETVRSALAKAGILEEDVDMEDCVVTRYQTTEGSMHYRDWVKFKNLSHDC